MGRWVRWFGTPTDTVEVAPPPAQKPAKNGRLMRMSVAKARVVAAGEVAISKAATPTGQMSVQQLSAEMLTAILVQDGLLSTADEHAALQEHRATGRPVEELLVRCEPAVLDVPRAADLAEGPRSRPPGIQFEPARQQRIRVRGRRCAHVAA